MLIIGDKEVANGDINVNSYKKGDLGNSTLAQFEEMILNEIDTRAH